MSRIWFAPLVIAATLLGGSWWLSSVQTVEAETQSERALTHSVYFSLKDNTPAKCQKLVDVCKEYLAKHDGVLFFAAGVVGNEFDRPVNDRDYDVALHIVFRDKESHDQYQVSPMHTRFVDEYRDQFAKVRVFDSWVDIVPVSSAK